MKRIALIIFLLSYLIAFKAFTMDQQSFSPIRERQDGISPNRENVWVFMMAGQSNMAGRAKIGPPDTLANKRILVMQADGKVALAREPLHLYEPTMTGLDCGASFANHLLKSVPDSVSILLVPTAVGGSSIDQWLGDSLHRGVKLRTNFGNLAKLSGKYGVIKGILWHQGESDADQGKVNSYQQKLHELFAFFRQEVDNEKIPILTGPIGTFNDQNHFQKQINDSIIKNAKSDPHTFVVRTSDLEHKGDRLHYDAKSQRKLGKRFAKLYARLIRR